MIDKERRCTFCKKWVRNIRPTSSGSACYDCYEEIGAYYEDRELMLEEREAIRRMYDHEDC